MVQKLKGKLKKPLVWILLFLAIPLFVLYFVAMVVWPFASSGWDWGYVQEVWGRWQTFNAAMIALGASFIALWAARRQAAQQKELVEGQRRREFVAAKAFLTASLSELHGYFDDVNVTYSNLYLSLPWEGYFDESDTDTLALELPKLPSSYQSVFRDCIVHAPPDVAEFMASILSMLQIIHSRIGGLNERSVGYRRSDVVSEILNVAMVHAKCERLYPYARENEPLVFDPVDDSELLSILKRRTYFWNRPGVTTEVFDAAIALIVERSAGED